MWTVQKGTWRALLSALFALLLASCSWFSRGEDLPVYYGSEEIDYLVVPDDLDKPKYVNPLVILARDVTPPSPDETELLPPRVASTAGQSDLNAWLSWSAEGVYLKVRDSSESVTRRLGFAIERSGMNLLDMNPAGAYRFEFYHQRVREKGFFKKMMFWRDDGPDYSGIYQTEVRADGNDTRVYLLQGDGAPAPNRATEHILAVFMERLG